MYSSSYDTQQLSGGELPQYPDKSCEFGLSDSKIKNIPINKIYPCGLIANSLFNGIYLIKKYLSRHFSTL